MNNLQKDLINSIKLNTRNLEVTGEDYLKSISESIDKLSNQGYLKDEDVSELRCLIDKYTSLKRELVSRLNSVTVEPEFCSFDDIVKELKGISSDGVAKKLFSDYTPYITYEEFIVLLLEVPKCISYIADLDLGTQLELVSRDIEVFSYIRNPYEETRVLYNNMKGN